MKNKKTASITAGIIAIATLLFQYMGPNVLNNPDLSIAPNISYTRHSVIEALYAKRESDTIVETTGKVVKLLADDLEGSKHQKFILELSSGHTLLVSHNIDLAPRINALKRNDTVTLKGEYEWTKRMVLLIMKKISLVKKPA
jgi:hypothetical protein